MLAFSFVKGESGSQKETEDKLKLQQQESTRRENVLVMRLATKEQEMQELLVGGFCKYMIIAIISYIYVFL